MRGSLNLVDYSDLIRMLAKNASQQLCWWLGTLVVSCAHLWSLDGFRYPGTARASSSHLLRERLDEVSSDYSLFGSGVKFSISLNLLTAFCGWCESTMHLPQPRLAYSIGSGYSSVRHSRMIGEVYDSDLIGYFVSIYIFHVHENFREQLQWIIRTSMKMRTPTMQ